MRLVAWRGQEGQAEQNRRCLYKGPLARVTDEDGTVFPRGECVQVPAAKWELLRLGPAAGQFVFVADERSSL